jgi:predicted ester cyclase
VKRNGLRATFLSVWFAAFCLGGCGSAEHAALDLEGDKRRVAEYLQAFLIDRDWEQWPAYFAAAATINDADLALQIMRGTADGLNYSFAELDLTVVQQIAEPPRVATFFVIEGRHQKPFNDQPPTNRRIQLDGFVIDRFEDDKVVESRMFMDVWGLSRRAAAAGRTSD